MKKIVNTSFFYGILGLLSGAFYREFTKFLKFTGETRLSLTHGHVLGLGMLFFLIIAGLEKSFSLSEDPKFKRFFNLYNISLSVVVVVFYIKGIADVLGVDFSKAVLASIDGIAGLSHIVLTYAIIVFLNILRRRVNN